MNWSEVGPDIVKVAPIIAGILGGPAGAAASAVGSILASVLNVDSKPEAVSNAVKGDPTALAHVRDAEQLHRNSLAELHLASTTRAVASPSTTPPTSDAKTK